MPFCSVLLYYYCYATGKCDINNRKNCLRNQEQYMGRQWGTKTKPYRVGTPTNSLASALSWDESLPLKRCITMEIP